MRRAWILVVLCVSTSGAVAWASTEAKPKHVNSRPAHRRRPVGHKVKHRAPKVRHRHKRRTRKPTILSRKSWSAKPRISAGTDPVLFGDETIEATTDNETAGQTAAFPFSNSTAGTTASISVYVDTSNAAKTLIVGLYSDRKGQPGSLLTQGSSSLLVGGAWNQVSISSAAVSSGRTYWIAVLGRGGQFEFRDRAAGPCTSEISSQTSLTSLPSAWKTGAQRSTCPISAYVNGYLVSRAVTPALPSDTTLPAVTGATTQGQTLSTSNGSWGGSPTSYSYQWRRCDTNGANCSDISGASQSSYTLAAADVGHTIRAVVTATNAGGSTPATSNQTAAVQADPPAAPSNTTLPAVTGATTQGQTLSTSNGSWGGSPTSYSYQWRRCDTNGANCSDISGASQSSYTLAAADVGHTIRAVVTATNAGGSTPATSNQTAAVQADPPAAPSNTTLPAVTGATTQGQTLSTSNGSWGGSPTSYSYQWRRCDTNGANCSDISGASQSSYTLAAADVGHTIRAVVTATNAGGSTPATSNQTAAVQADPPAAPSNTTLPAVTGATTQGQTLSTSNGSWGGSPTSYSYQWRRCDTNGANCSDISGASQSSYTLAAADVGHTIRAVVTATNAGGSTPATSNQTAAVTAPSSSTNCAGAKGSGVVSQTSLDACGLPSMNTTGPVAGTTFTNSASFNANTAGQVYNGLNVNGEINVNANNVTIQNSNITAVDPNTAAIKVASGVTGVKILNDSIHGTNALQSGSLAFAVSYYGSSISGVTIDHTNFYNGDRILMGYGTVTNSYCLGGAVFQSGGYTEHDECIYTDGAAPGIRAIHDTLLNANPYQTAAIFVDNPDYGGGGANGTLDVENSLLAGGDYCLYGGQGNAGTNHTGTETIVNNRFARLFFSTCGQFGPDAYMPSGVKWSGNVWDDNNQAITGP